jgi:excisionase family DNA binding protein
MQRQPANSVLTSLGQIRPGDFYGLAELAPLLKVSTVTLNREVNAGKLVAAKVRGQWRVQGKDFLAYLEACQKENDRPRPKKGSPSSGRGQPFTKLNADRLLAAWHRQDAGPDQPGGRSAPPSG